MPRTHSTHIGPHEIIAITDGHTQFGSELFPGTDDAKIDALLAKAGAKTIDTEFNAFVVKSPDRILLVDAGPRDLFGPTCGNLHEGLKEAGVSASDITHLMATHMHPDHIAGMITTDGTAVFENAAFLVHKTEHAFWAQDEAFGDETMDHWQQLAKTVLSAYRGRMETFGTDADLGGGVSTVTLAGHTPGHSGFRVDDGNDSFIMACDIVHAPALQIPDPEIAIAFDLDPDTARATRKRTLDMIATDGVLFSGGHLTSPKLAHLSRNGAGFALEGNC